MRHTLCKDTYIDWDMVNAHPVILFQLMRKTNRMIIYWLCLKRYHINREVKLKEVQEVHGVSRGFQNSCLFALSTTVHTTVGRNVNFECPCACGSGKNAKNCCNKYNENDEN